MQSRLKPTLEKPDYRVVLEGGELIGAADGHDRRALLRSEMLLSGGGGHKTKTTIMWNSYAAAQTNKMHKQSGAHRQPATATPSPASGRCEGTAAKSNLINRSRAK